MVEERTIICEICGVTKTFFGKKNRFTCSKRCANIREKQRAKEWRQDNKAYARTYMRSWNAKNHQHVLELNKKYRDSNTNMLNLRQKIYKHAAIILRKRHQKEYDEIVNRLIEIAESKTKVYNRKPKNLNSSSEIEYYGK